LDHRFVSGDRGERVLAGHRELAGEEDPAQSHEAGTPLFPIRTLAALFPQAGTGSPMRFRTRSALSVITLLGSPTASREKGLSLSLYFGHHFGSLPAFRSSGCTASISQPPTLLRFFLTRARAFSAR